MRTLKHLFIIILLLSLMSCEEDYVGGFFPDEVEEYDGEFITHFGDPVNRNFIGIVQDERGFPIDLAEVRIGDKLVYTDENGVFIIRDVTVYEKYASAKVQKEGYFQGASNIIPEDGVNRLQITLVSKIVTKRIQSGRPETVSLLTGGSISLNGNYTDNNGAAYTGELDVILHYDEPTDDSDILGMPMGAGSKKHVRFIEKYSTLLIELRAVDGSLLKIAENEQVVITFPVKADLASIAPNKIPLWIFNMSGGYWDEKGEASKKGNSYEATVNKIGFWCIGSKYFSRTIKVDLKDSNNHFIANQPIEISYSGTNYPYKKRSFLSSQNTRVSTIIPTKKNLTLEVYKHKTCDGNRIILKNIDSGEEDLDEHIVLTADDNIIVEEIKGTFFNCDEEQAEETYVSLKMGNESFINMAPSGNYNIFLTRCNSITRFSVDVLDFSNNSQRTGVINYHFTSPSTSLGELMPCDSVNEFIQYTIDNSDEKARITQHIYTGFNPMNPGYNAPSITIFDQNADSKFNLFGLLNASPYTGTYDNYVIGEIEDRGMNIGQKIDVSNTNNNIHYELVKLGEPGEYIDMHFSGNYEDNLGAAHHIVGIVHVIRD